MRLPRRNLQRKKRSQQSEKRAAATIRGRVQPGSGALPVLGFKSDAKSDEFLLEDKTTKAASYRLTIADWRKNASAAYKQGLKPVFRVEFEDGPTLFTVDEATFKALIDDGK